MRVVKLVFLGSIEAILTAICNVQDISCLFNDFFVFVLQNGDDEATVFAE